MPTLLIVQIAGGRPFDDRFKKTIGGSVEQTDTTQTTSIRLDTMITTEDITGDVETREIPSGENNPSHEARASV